VKGLVVESGVAVGGRVTYAAASHEALRARNEDRALVAPELGLFGVADGMGGHADGAKAATLAVETMAHTVRERMISGPLDRHAAILSRCAQAANLAVWEAGRGQGVARMGTTLEAVLVTWPWLLGVHVGDSRVYLLRHGALVQLTEDHTVRQDYIRRGLVTADEATALLPANVITRALGAATVNVDAWNHRVRPGDSFLICSDGLHGALPDSASADALTQALRAGLGAEGAMRALFARVAPFASDNVTAVLLCVGGPAEIDASRYPDRNEALEGSRS
jgi:protein phosphatase